MTLRDQVTQVLVRKGVRPREIHDKWYENLVNDLCTLFTPPTPDREALDRTVEIAYQDGYFMVGHLNKLKEALMAWASGQPAKPEEWCPHIEQAVDGNNIPRFWMKGVLPPVADKWTVCPICAVPKPEMSRYVKGTTQAE